MPDARFKSMAKYTTVEPSVNYYLKKHRKYLSQRAKQSIISDNLPATSRCSTEAVSRLGRLQPFSKMFIDQL